MKKTKELETHTKEIRSPSNSRIELLESMVEQGNYTQALLMIQDSANNLEMVLSPVDRGDTCYLASVCMYHLGQYHEALNQARQAFELFKHTSENNKVAQIQDILGRINLSLGDLRNAESYARDGITTYRRIGDHTKIMKSYNLLARIFFIKCDFEKSIEYLAEARELSQKVGNSRMVSVTSGNSGRIYTLLGDWKKAETNLLISLDYNRKYGDELGLCRDLLSLGFTKCLERNFTKSKEYLNEALVLATKNDALRESAIYYEYAGQVALGEADEKTAKSYFLKAIEIGQRAAPAGDINNQTYRLLAELHVAQKHFDQAFQACQKSLEVSRSLGEKIEEGVVYKILGQVFSARGEKEKAGGYFKQSISLLQQLGARYELAKTYLEAGRSNSFDYYKRLGFLSNAESLFRDLESKYYLGSVNLSISNLLVEHTDYGKAEVFLSDAEVLFKDSNDRQELHTVADLRHSIEEALFKTSMLAKSNGKVTFDNIVTQNTEMTEILEKLKQIKDYDISILLEGETGSGKDLISKAIHYSSRRKDKRFVAINCAALPESLLENELFGHKKGAYTGADRDQRGLFEEAEGGTLYLDQVEEIPLSTQVKLLRAIEEKEITRLGETKPRKIDVRIISSSIEDLKEVVKNGKFRQDLYFRLNTFDIAIPPLRERKEDILLLSKHFLKEYGMDDKRIREFERNGTTKRFLEYGWPGNVRELENEIKRMVVLSSTGEKDPARCLSEKLIHSAAPPPNFDEGTLFHIVEEFEKEKIIEALRQCNWIKLRAAKLLGIPEATLRNKMKRYKLSHSVSVPYEKN